MVTEVVEIVVRDRGAQATSRNIRQVGRSSRTAARAVTALVGVLATLAAGRGLARIATGAIEASASFEQYGVRLRALLGSQEEANKALDSFIQLSTKTPFAVSQIVEGASTLAAAALGNRERLEELTVTAANLAAVTGLSFQEAAGNLQRTLTAGIGAADLFRDRGVRALVESISGIPDLTKAPLEEVEAQFVTIFGAGGTFGSAAENLSFTLGGALSNIGDAATNTRVALGDAFSPAVINAARQVIIPFLTQLQASIVGNEEAITRFAADAVRGTISGLLTLAQAALAVIQAFDQLATGIGQTFDAVLGTLVQVGAAAIELQLNLQEAIGDTAGAEQSRATLQRLNATIDDLAGETRAAGEETDAFQRKLDSINDVITEIQRNVDRTDFASTIDAGADITLPEGVGGAEGGVTAATKEQEAALTRIGAITNRLRIADAARLDPLDAQLERLAQQEAALRLQADAAGDLAAAEEGLDIIARQRVAIEQQKVSELARQEELQAQILLLLQQAALVSPELVASIREAADAAVAAGGGLETVNKELAQVVSQGSKEIEQAGDSAKRLGDSINTELKGAVGSAIRGAISGEGVDAMQLLADTGSRLLEESFNTVLEGLGGQLTSLLGGGGGGGGIPGLGGAGGIDFGGLLGAGLGAGFSILAGSIRDTSSNISNNLIRSAATESSAAATRGVIAGPTNIPIFQVGESIEAAFVETNDILSEILGVLRLSAAVPGAVGGGSDAAFALETTTPSIA